MARSYDEAVVALYQSPHAAFVTERKRLAAELKASGDSAGAVRLGKLGRPSVAAWAVNQLFWRARRGFEELFETAERLRGGDLAATSAHREALAKLRAHAVKLLEADGHPATEATLRRVTTTLSALAAAGSFAPDPAGALSGDRDPPGFEGFAIASSAGARADAAKRATSGSTASQAPRDEFDARRRQKAEAARARAEAAAERRRVEEELAKRKAERQRLTAALRVARDALAEYERESERLRRELSAASKSEEKARAEVEELERRLEALG